MACLPSKAVAHVGPDLDSVCFPPLLACRCPEKLAISGKQRFTHSRQHTGQQAASKDQRKVRLGRRPPAAGLVLVLACCLVQTMANVHHGCRQRLHTGHVDVSTHRVWQHARDRRAVYCTTCCTWHVSGPALPQVEPYQLPCPVVVAALSSVCPDMRHSCATVSYRSAGSNASSKNAWPHAAANGDLAGSSGSARAAVAAAGGSVHSSASEDVLGTLQAKAAGPSMWGSAEQQQQQQYALQQQQQQRQQNWQDQAAANMQVVEHEGARTVPSEVSQFGTIMFHFNAPGTCCICLGAHTPKSWQHRQQMTPVVAGLLTGCCCAVLCFGCVHPAACTAQLDVSTQCPSGALVVSP